MIVSPCNAAKMSAKRMRSALVAGSALLCLLSAGQLWAFNLDDVSAKAKELAGQKFEAPRSNLPNEFRDMKFADYQKIRFLTEKAEWADQKTPFKLSFYHQGMHFDTPVKINEITANTVEEIKYDPTRFDFGDLKFDPKATEQLGYAGFRVLYPINKADKQDEIMTMLGASYFRVVGKGHTYGLSARGLAIDTALPSGEEFPRFREFWIQQPKPGDKHLVIFALLDSPRATGAYRLIVRPGSDTIVDVKAQMFLRDKVGKLGIAPLTSMFLFGANQPSKVLNYRRELHDSSGLSIHAGNGEWIWRPLNNPKHLAVSNFSPSRTRVASVCCNVAVTSATTKTSMTATTSVQVPGSSQKAIGARVLSTWSKFRPPTKPTTTSLRSGARKPLPEPGQATRRSPIACTGPSTKLPCTHRTALGSNRPCAPRVM